MKNNINSQNSNIDDNGVEAAPTNGFLEAGSTKVISGQGVGDIIFKQISGDVTGISLKGGNLIVSFANNSTLIIENFNGSFAEAKALIESLDNLNIVGDLTPDTDGDNEPASSQTDAQGDEDVDGDAIAQLEELKSIEPAAGDAETAQALARVQPAAGDAAGADSRGGFGFNSDFQAQGVIPLSDVGPIAPTALTFSLPEFREDLFLQQQASSVLLASLNPEFDAFDTQILEDGSQTVLIEAIPQSSDSFLTITISGIPSSWGVSGTGSYDPTTQEWTFTTTTAGSVFTGGPTLTPPADADQDLTGLVVSVFENNPVTGQNGTATGTFDVIVDAVADDPLVDGVDNSGVEGSALLADIPTALTGEERNAGGIGNDDGSETIVSIVISAVNPADDLNDYIITNVNGPVSLDVSGNIIFTDRTDLNGLTFQPKDPNFSGSLPLDVTINTQDNPNDAEFNNTNDTNYASDQFTLTWTPVIDPPSITVGGAANGIWIVEDTTESFAVNASLDANAAPSEVLSITVLGINLNNVDSYTLSNGPNGETWVRTNADDSNASFELTLQPNTDYNGTFTFTPKADSDLDIGDLQFTATATDPSALPAPVSATVNDTFFVYVDADIDSPSVNGDDASGSEGVTLAMNIDDAFTGEENNAGKTIGSDDGSETIVDIVIETTDSTDLSNFNIINANGAVSLDASGNIVFTDRADLVGLQITPKDSSFNGSVDFKVTINTTENANDNEQSSANNTDSENDTFTLTWNPDANPPTVLVNNGVDDAIVIEDNKIDVPVTASLDPNGSGNEILSLTISGVDLTKLEGGANGFDASNGPNGETWVRVPGSADNNASFTITLTTPATDYAGNFTFEPKADSDLDLTNIVVTASAFEPATSTTATSGPDNFNVIVDADIDPAVVDGLDDSGQEGDTLDIEIPVALTGEENNAGGIGNDDGSERIESIVISPKDPSVDLNNFTIINSNGPVSLDASGNIVFTDRTDLNGLQITPKDPTFNGSIQLYIALNTTENPVSDGESSNANNSTQATDTITLTWNPVINPPSIEVGGGANGIYIKEDGSKTFDVDAELNANAAPNEVLSITVTGINLDNVKSYTLSNGPNGETWVRTNADDSNASFEIILQPGSNYDGAFTFVPKDYSDLDIGDLSFKATATDNSVAPALSASANDNFFVYVDAVADPVDIAATGGTEEEGTPIAVDIDGFPSADTDGSEAITGYEVRGDATEMSGFTFTVNGAVRTPVAGVLTLAPSEIDALVVTPKDASFTGTLNLTAHIFNTDTANDNEQTTGDNTSTDEAGFSLTWTDDDKPVISNVTKSVDESDMNPNDVATGKITVDFGDDAAGATITGDGSFDIGTITSNGNPVSVNYNPTTNTYTGVAGGNDVFTLVIQNNGDYTFTLLDTLDHPVSGDNSNGEHDDKLPLKFGVIATDGDNDSSTAQIIINVADDGPQAVVDTNGFDIDDGSTLGNVLDNDIFSEDQSNTVTAIRVQGGAFIDIPAGGSQTISTQYGDLTIGSDGQYTFTVNAASSGLDNFSDIFEYKLSDGDDDFSIATLTINADGDDTPVNVKTQTLVVDETDIDTAAPTGVDSASGQATANFGADNPGTFEVGSANTVTFSGTKTGNTLTSNGEQVVITTIGNKYVGSTSAGTIFDLIIESDGNYTFNLYDQLDHGVAGDLATNPASHDDSIKLRFDVVAKDSDGDTATKKIVVTVKDDGVDAIDDVVSYETGDDGTSGNVLANDILGEDELHTVTSFEFGGQTANVPDNGSATLDGKYGSLTMNSDGSYSYDLFDGLDTTETTYTYTIDNPPGGSAAGEISNVTSSYNEDTGLFNFSTTIDQRSTGFTLAINNGPNPKGHDELALLYFDATGATPVITIYSYNGLNTQTSWQDGSSDAGVQAPGKILSSLLDPSAFGSISAVSDGSGNTVFSFSLDVSVVNSFTPPYGDPAEWTGMQFDESLGIWLHSYEGLATSYDNGYLTSWNIESQSYYDSANKSTDVDITCETLIEEQFTYTVTDADGDTDQATVTLSGEVTNAQTLTVGQNVDDIDGSTTPWLVGNGDGTITGGHCNNIIVGDAGGSQEVPQTQNYNVLFVLDVSGSMGSLSDPNSRLSLLVDSIENLLNDFANYGTGEVVVHFAPFSTNANPGSTFTLTNGSELTDAIAYLNTLTNSGTTNYEAGLQNGIQWLQSGNALSNAETITYFISDDQPNRYLNNTGGVAIGSTTEIIDEITGVSDGTDEVSQIQALSDEVIGVSIDINDPLKVINIIDSDGNATNVDDPNDLNSVLQETNPVNRLDTVGGDRIEAGAGTDIIFGDTMNTDALAVLEGITLDEGAGWEVFERLENGEGNTSDWDRDDTISYIEDNAQALAVENVGSQNTRSGGDDVIFGGEGDDLIFGQEGNDIIIGGEGQDTLNGGSGSDVFLFEAANDAGDIIQDFVIGEDILDVSALLGGYVDLQAAINGFVFTTEQNGSDTVVKFDADGSTGAQAAVEIATLEGISVTNIEDILKTGTTV